MNPWTELLADAGDEAQGLVVAVLANAQEIVDDWLDFEDRAHVKVRNLRELASLFDAMDDLLHSMQLAHEARDEADRADGEAQS